MNTSRLTAHSSGCVLIIRERSQASNFTAALDDYRQFLRRQREAEQMKQRFDAARDEEQPATADEQALPLPDYSLKPGQTIKLKLSNVSVDVIVLQGGNANVVHSVFL